MLLSANQGCRTEALAKCKFDLILMSNTGSACLRDHPSQRLMIKCLTIIQIEFEFANGGFWGEGKTGVPGEKPLGTRKRTNNKETQPTYDAGSGNRTLDTLVGGERSHHCSIPVPQSAAIKSLSSFLIKRLTVWNSHKYHTFGYFFDNFDNRVCLERQCGFLDLPQAEIGKDFLKV